MTKQPDPNSPQAKAAPSPETHEPGSDPWRQERDEFVRNWVDSNEDLSDAAADYLRELVYADNGPWTYPEYVESVFEPPNESGVIYIVYSTDGETVEIPFRYK